MKKQHLIQPEEPASIRAQYEQRGVQRFYEEHGSQYRNPHEQAIRQALRLAITTWKPDLSKVLDLACGSGEVTLALREMDGADITGIDPYTGEAYLERTGQQAEASSFEQIAAGALAGLEYSLIVCSFALHLVEESRLPTLAYQLSRIGKALLALTPHKRPMLKADWGWKLVGEITAERVRARYYESAAGG